MYNIYQHLHQNTDKQTTTTPSAAATMKQQQESTQLPLKHQLLNKRVMQPLPSTSLSASINSTTLATTTITTSSTLQTTSNSASIPPSNVQLKSRMQMHSPLRMHLQQQQQLPVTQYPAASPRIEQQQSQQRIRSSTLGSGATSPRRDNNSPHRILLNKDRLCHKQFYDIEINSSHEQPHSHTSTISKRKLVDLRKQFTSANVTPPPSTSSGLTSSSPFTYAHPTSSLLINRGSSSGLNGYQKERSILNNGLGSGSHIPDLNASLSLQFESRKSFRRNRQAEQISRNILNTSQLPSVGRSTSPPPKILSESERIHRLEQIQKHQQIQQQQLQQLNQSLIAYPGSKSIDTHYNNQQHTNNNNNNHHNNHSSAVSSSSLSTISTSQPNAQLHSQQQQQQQQQKSASSRSNRPTSANILKKLLFFSRPAYQPMSASPQPPMRESSRQSNSISVSSQSGVNGNNNNNQQQQFKSRQQQKMLEQQITLPPQSLQAPSILAGVAAASINIHVNNNSTAQKSPASITPTLTPSTAPVMSSTSAAVPNAFSPYVLLQGSDRLQAKKNQPIKPIKTLEELEIPTARSEYNSQRTSFRRYYEVTPTNVSQGRSRMMMNEQTGIGNHALSPANIIPRMNTQNSNNPSRNSSPTNVLKLDDHLQVVRASVAETITPIKLLILQSENKHVIDSETIQSLQQSNPMSIPAVSGDKLKSIIKRPSQHSLSYLEQSSIGGSMGSSTALTGRKSSRDHKNRVRFASNCIGRMHSTPASSNS